MFRNISFVCITTLMLGLLAAPAAAQCNSGCDSCGQARAGWGGLHGSGQWRERHDELMAYGDKIENRVQMWPKPFQCYDRQIYHSMIQTSYDRGWEVECTLTDLHFDMQTNELNQSGLAKVAGVMINLPRDKQQLFVYEVADESAVQNRVNNVRKALATNYRHMPAPIISRTTRMAHGISGVLVENTQKRFVESQPIPAVPTASKTGVSASVK